MNNPLILALDFDRPEALQPLLERLDTALCRLKVGLELFTIAGPPLVRDLVRRGYDVFLDLKFHDIPNTVAAACRAAAELGVWMVDVHTQGGEAMLLAAREALLPFGATAPKLVGITLLTSLGDADLAAVGLAGSGADNVDRLARLAQRSGLDGVVCSALEAPPLRHALGADFLLVTPGIRLPDQARHDQVRVLGPAEALRAGASHLVVGRPITRSPDPVATLLQFRTLIQSVAVN